MFRTKFLKSIKGYDKKIKNCEDFDLILRIEKNLKRFLPANTILQLL